MTIIHSLRNTKAYKKFDGEIGLEIETETRNPYKPPEFTFWRVHGDGSLRDFGQEYVLAQPLKYGKELQAGLNEWADKTAKIPFNKDSISTSVHVHLNMLNETWQTLGNFLTQYTLFENLLIRYSGPDRLSNLFALPICDAEDTYKNMMTLFRSVEQKNYRGVMFPEGTVKYAACNLGALGMYGSVEFRSFRGSTDIEQIGKWIDILYSMLDFARDKKLDPKKILGLYKDQKEELLRTVFKDLSKELDYKDKLQLMDRNLWYAQNIAYPIKDWAQLDVEAKIPDFKPKTKELDGMSLKLFGVREFSALNSSQQEATLFELRKLFNKKHGVTPEFVMPVFNEPEPVRRARRIDAGAFVAEVGGDPVFGGGEPVVAEADEAVRRARDILNRQAEARRVRRNENPFNIEENNE